MAVVLVFVGILASLPAVTAATKVAGTALGGAFRAFEPYLVVFLRSLFGYGGRYDGLVGQLGGKAAPACGFAMGIERLIALIRDAGGEPAAPAPDVYMVHQGEAASRLAFRVAEGLRDQGIAVLLHCGGGSFKSQMKKADGSGATFAVIIGDDEAATGEAQLKPLREEGAAQLKLKVDDLAEAIIGQLIDSDEEE